MSDLDSKLDRELDRALFDIDAIRRQVARSTEFRGYGAATVAATGLFAVCAARIQALLLPDAATHMDAYLNLWIAAAALSATLTGAQMVTRTRRIHSGMSQEMLRQACEQFLPSVVAGVLLAVVIVRFVPAEMGMLPGLWQIVFSLGIFSSCRFLPRPMLAAGAWYLLAGMCVLSVGGPVALSPWAMGVPFGVGQLLVAAVLLFARREAGE